MEQSAQYYSALPGSANLDLFLQGLVHQQHVVGRETPSMPMQSMVKADCFDRSFSTTFSQSPVSRRIGQLHQRFSQTMRTTFEEGGKGNLRCGLIPSWAVRIVLNELKTVDGEVTAKVKKSIPKRQRAGRVSFSSCNLNNFYLSIF